MARARTIIVVTIAALALNAAPSAASQLADASTDPLLAPVSACAGQTQAEASPKVQVRAMLCLHRYAREQVGARPAHKVRRLQTSARRKAGDLLRCQEFSHTACGRDTFYWFKRVGYMDGIWGVGENLAWGTGELGSARAMMSAWLESPAHRQILLNRQFRQIGIGLVAGNYQGARGAQFWVAHFGYRN